MMKNSFLSRFVFLTLSILSLPFHEGRPIEKEITVYFPIANDRIESGFGQNRDALADLVATLGMMLAPGSPYRIDSVVVEGSASPLGGETFNRDLSRRRSESMAAWLRLNASLPDSLIRIRNTGANWPALRRMVEGSSMKYRAEVLDVIDRVPVDRRRNYVLMELRGGDPYREMMHTFFPDLQSATTCILYARLLTEIVPPAAGPVAVASPRFPAEINPVPELPAPAGERQPLINLSTNLLYWGALAPNIGIELCAPRNHWSVNAEFVQPWWKKSSEHKYYQIRQFSGEARYWLKGDGIYRGHFFGAYGNGGIYDLENGGTGYKGNFWGAGVTYGYVLKLRPRFRLEFSLGVGYLSPKYEQYEPIDNCYVYEKTVRKGYVGPTKAKVGLVWTIVQRKNQRNK